MRKIKLHIYWFSNTQITTHVWKCKRFSKFWWCHQSTCSWCKIFMEIIIKVGFNWDNRKNKYINNVLTTNRYMYIMFLVIRSYLPIDGYITFRLPTFFTYRFHNCFLTLALMWSYDYVEFSSICIVLWYCCRVQR